MAMQEIKLKIVEAAGQRPAPPSTETLQTREAEAQALFEIFMNQDVLSALAATTDTSCALIPLGKYQSADTQTVEHFVLKITKNQTGDLQATLEAKQVIELTPLLSQAIRDTQGTLTEKTACDYFSKVSREYRWRVIKPDDPHTHMPTENVYVGTRPLNIEALALSHYDNLDAIGKKILDILKPPAEAALE